MRALHILALMYPIDRRLTLRLRHCCVKRAARARTTALATPTAYWYVPALQPRLQPRPCACAPVTQELTNLAIYQYDMVIMECGIYRYIVPYK